MKILKQFMDFFDILHYKADIRTLIWAFFLIPFPLVMQLWQPSSWPIMFPLSLLTSFIVGTMAHNINHKGIFKTNLKTRKGRFLSVLNELFGSYISVWYGFPIFGWIPTHNENHHKFLNRDGDATITWRHSKENGTLTALAYPFVSVYYQSDLISNYLTKARKEKPHVYRSAMMQYAIAYGCSMAVLALSVYLHGPKPGLIIYLRAMFFPSLMSSYDMMFINYIQHVHCDPNDPYNHSRNFSVGAGGDESKETWLAKVEQFLNFNAGFHQAHHDKAFLHWSLLPADHYERLGKHTHHDLQCSSLTWYLFSTYILGNLFGMKQYYTKQIGNPAWETKGTTTPETPPTEPASPLGKTPPSTPASTAAAATLKKRSTAKPTSPTTEPRKLSMVG